MPSNITGRLINAVRFPVRGGIIIRGEIYEDVHGRFYDGAVIYTTLVIMEEGNIITTKNSIYEVESWRDNEA